MNKEFIPYEEALALKELGSELDNCFGFFISSINESYHINSNVEFRGCKPYKSSKKDEVISAPLYQQALVFLYNKSNGQVNISINGKDTNEERNQKIKEGIQALRNIQNSKS